MKNKYFLALFFTLFILNACKKESGPVTKEVPFTVTTYDSLGGYDPTGLPFYLTTSDVISPGLISFINTNLPDGKNLPKLHPELFASAAVADINVTASSNVYVTFVTASAGVPNTVGFYTYPTGHPPASAQDVSTITYIFPSAGNYTPLHPGDKVKIGNFAAGTTIAFVLFENSWNLATGQINDNAVHFCTDDILNPEIDPKLKRHAVLLNYIPENKVLISFDDTNRTSPDCDNDFNDVVIYCTVTP